MRKTLFAATFFVVSSLSALAMAEDKPAAAATPAPATSIGGSATVTGTINGPAIIAAIGDGNTAEGGVGVIGGGTSIIGDAHVTGTIDGPAIVAAIGTNNCAKLFVGAVGVNGCPK